jgi:hypothetical protein
MIILTPVADQYKREVVIARVMLTGKICYPVYGAGGKCVGCLRCDRGPCCGPLEKYDERS